VTSVQCITGSMPWDKWLDSKNKNPNRLAAEHQVIWKHSGLVQAPDAKMRGFLDLVLSELLPDVTLRFLTFNNFPTACGIASSASGFAALIGSLADLFNLTRFFGADDLGYWCAEWARIGSGSATRSALPFVPTQESKKQFVAWELNQDLSFPTTLTKQIEVGSLFQVISSCVVVIDAREKKTSSSDGHKSVRSSPLFGLRHAQMPVRQKQLVSALQSNDFGRVAEIAERDAFEMHSLMQTSTPPALYFDQKTSHFIEQFVKFRDETNCKAFWTLDAGPNVHLLFLKSEFAQIELFLEKFSLGAFATRVLWNESDEGFVIGKSSDGVSAAIRESVFLGGHVERC
jgi:diphosphomevalonate decarboxylase